MIGRRVRSAGGWIWIAVGACAVACGGKVASGSREDGSPGRGETSDASLPARAFEVQAGPRDPDDPDDRRAFTVLPGVEEWICFTTRLDNPEQVQVRRVSVVAGEGVTRVDVNAVHDDRNTGLDPCEAHLPYVPLYADGSPGFDPDVPENAGLAFELPPRATVVVWMNALAVTERDVTARATVRLEETREPATRILRPLLWSASAPDAQSTSTEQLESGNECVVPSERRISALMMHTHDAHCSSSQVTLRQSPSARLLYSKDRRGRLPSTLFFDPLRDHGPNGDLDAATGASGVVAVFPGDRLRFRCAFAPDSPVDLRQRDFSCTVFGSYTARPGSDEVWRCE